MKLSINKNKLTNKAEVVDIIVLKKNSKTVLLALPLDKPYNGRIIKRKIRALGAIDL